MEPATTAALRNEPLVRERSRKPLASAPLRFGSVQHLLDSGHRSSPCDASETAFLRRTARQKTDRDQPSSPQCLARQAERAPRLWQCLAVCGERIARLRDLESRL